MRRRHYVRSNRKSGVFSYLALLIMFAGTVMLLIYTLRTQETASPLQTGALLMPQATVQPSEYDELPASNVFTPD